MHASYEARIAYANGLFLATVLLSSACIEGEIAIFLYNKKVATWKEIAKMDFHALIKRAHEEKIISSEECKELNELRRIRNSIAHAQESPAEEFELVVVADPLTGKTRKGVRFEKEAKRAFEILRNFILKHCCNIAVHPRSEVP